MIIGIDFGTTKTVAARYDNHRTQVMTDRRGRRSLPSLVLVTPEKTLFVGREAATHAQRYKSEHISITSIKRSLGRQGETGWGWWKTHPQEVAALILGRLKLEIETQHDSEITGAVIAIPAHFDINQRWAVAQAAEAAGVKVLRLLNEATAVALNYCMTRVIPDSKILVFDFGGGTLDVSVLELGQGIGEVKAIAGDGDLGGDDFDQVLLNHVLEEAKAQIGRSADLAPTDLLVLKETVTRAKAELSSAQSTQIYVPGLFRDSNRNHRPLDLTITRDTFNHLTKELLRRTEEVIQKALNDASIKRQSDLNGVLMIGGTARIPAVRELLRKKIGLSPHVGVDPETCVAEGAAIQAAVLTGNLQKMLLLDGLPRSLSIATAGGVTKLIIRNTTFPTRKSQEFSTTQHNQTQIEVNIFEGESDVVKENAYVGRIVLSNIPPAPKGTPKIEVIFDIDGSGTLQATAHDVGTGRKTEAVISAPYRLNAAQIKVIGRKVEKALSLTKLTITREVEKDQDMTVRNAALECVRRLGQFLEAHQHELSVRGTQVLLSGRELILEFLDREAPREDIGRLIEGLNLELNHALATLVCESLVLICEMMSSVYGSLRRTKEFRKGAMLGH
jgi:molecular chaperone DnaK